METIATCRCRGCAACSPARGACTRNATTPKGKCDECGQALTQRDDDKAPTIRRRLALYHQSTEELVPHYQAQRLLCEVDGVGDIETIYGHILQTLQQPRKNR